MIELSKRRLARCLAVCAFLTSAPSAIAAEVTMLTSMAFHATYLELVPLYEQASGNSVMVDWSPALQVARRVEAGEEADIAVLAAAGVDSLIEKGFLAEGSRVDLAKSLVGVAIRVGAPRPDLSSGEGLKRSLLAAERVALSAGTSSFYMERLFRQMGIEEQIVPKLVQDSQGRRENVAVVLRRGDGDLGFQQVSQFVDEDGIEYVGPLPPDVQEVTVFSAGISRSASDPETARDLLRFLTRPEAAAILRKHGLEPV